MTSRSRRGQKADVVKTVSFHYAVTGKEKNIGKSSDSGVHAEECQCSEPAKSVSAEYNRTDWRSWRLNLHQNVKPYFERSWSPARSNRCPF